MDRVFRHTSPGVVSPERSHPPLLLAERGPMIANLSSYQRPLTLMIFISVAALAMLFFMRPTPGPATLDPDSLATDAALAPNLHLQAPPSPPMRVTRTDTRLSTSTNVLRNDEPVLNTSLEDLVPIEQLKATEEFKTL